MAIKENNERLAMEKLEKIVNFKTFNDICINNKYYIKPLIYSLTEKNKTYSFCFLHKVDNKIIFEFKYKDFKGVNWVNNIKHLLNIHKKKYRSNNKILIEEFIEKRFIFLLRKDTIERIIEELDK